MLRDWGSGARASGFIFFCVFFLGGGVGLGFRVLGFSFCLVRS